MRARLAAVAVPLALLLAGCGSSGSGSSTTTGTSTVAQQTSTATSTVQTTTTTSTVAGPPACVASMLSASFLGQNNATGHGELGFALRNVSGGRCHTFGYPGVLFLDRAGHALPTRSTRTTHDFVGVAPEAELVLAPGATASFRVGVTHGAAATAPCDTAYGLQIIAPDDTATMRVKIPDGAYECRTATVSPLRPGTSAYR